MKLLSFSKRPAHTPLFITEQKTIRLDTDKAGIALAVAETIAVSCTNATKLPACLTACASAKPLGQKVWLLYAGLSSSFLTVPSSQVEGVDETTLIQALQFEWEGLTGQSSVDMQLAYRLLNQQDEMSLYWISQLNQLSLDDAHKALKKIGSQLAGILHPAGLPVCLSATNSNDWLRLETWRLQLVALRYNAEGLSRQAFSFEQRHWRKQLEQWLNEQGAIQHSETLHSLLAEQIELLPQTAENFYLSDELILNQWLTAWASALIHQQADVPILTVQSKLNKDVLGMVGGGLAALLICGGHLGWHLYQTNQYSQQVAELRKIEANLNGLNTAMTSDREKVDKLKEKLSKIKGDADSLPLLIQSVQQRPAQLLAALARGRPANLLLEEIAVEKDNIVIRGICLDAVAANELASYLEKQLATLGWSVAAPTKKNMALFPQGGPWEFALTLLDKGLAGFAKK